jgi:proteasome lid subunit RPN8/RPN11
MKLVRIDSRSLGQIERHARSRYPDEACGFLVSAWPEPEPDVRDIRGVVPTENRAEGEHRWRFAIRPEVLRELELRLDGSDEGVVGFYHSHPDLPSAPSESDRENAWPWYTYLITSISPDGMGPTTAFELESETRAFRAVELRVGQSRAGVGSGQRL